MALENKLGLTDSAELAREEERISKKRARELFENGMLDRLEAGRLSSLKAIHKYLFDDIYDFAGELRTVNISKGNFRFAPRMYLEAALESIEKMPQSTFDEIVEKYVEMNIAHPFREGNGRSTRIWLDLIFKAELNAVVDWSKVDKDDYLLAMERSPVRDIEIKHILRAALTYEVDSREVYMEGIDHSYMRDIRHSRQRNYDFINMCKKARREIVGLSDLLCLFALGLLVVNSSLSSGKTGDRNAEG